MKPELVDYFDEIDESLKIVGKDMTVRRRRELI